MGDRDHIIEKLKKLYKHAQSAEKIGSVSSTSRVCSAANVLPIASTSVQVNHRKG